MAGVAVYGYPRKQFHSARPTRLFFGPLAAFRKLPNGQNIPQEVSGSSERSTTC
jgi:hypothetical protein